MVITSINNEKVKYWVKLHDKKFRDQEGLFIVEGDHLVNEAIKHGLAKELITLEDFSNDIPTYKVTEQIMKKISKQQSIARVCAVCYKMTEKEIKNRVICLDNIQDPGNLGTIIRSSVAFNIDTILLNNESVDLYNDKVIRACEGMVFNINIIRCNLKSKLEELKKNDYKIIGTSVKNNKLLKDIEIGEKFAIVLGNEGKGISQEIDDLCDDHIYIKMNNKCESLNVGVSASILMYELNK